MMNRWLSCFSAIVWMICASSVAAQSDGFDIEGRYEILDPPQLTETGDQIEIVDVFWYGCPHCYQFLPAMEAFEQNKPDYIQIRRLPAIFRESWVAHARAFYTAQLLGVYEKVHRPLFEEIHEHERLTDDKESLGAFFEQHGVDRAEFNRTFDSFAVESMVRKSAVMQQRYGVQGTPTVIVNGKYRISGRLAGSYQNMIEIARQLAEQQHQGRSQASN